MLSLSAPLEPKEAYNFKDRTILVIHMTDPTHEQGLAWQVGVLDRMADTYQREIDLRFEPVVDQLLSYARLIEGEDVLDLGTGTGAVALSAIQQVGPGGSVTAIDISPEMLAIAKSRAEAADVSTIEFREGSSEAIPVENESHDVVLSSLVLMYVIDRETAAKEIARVLRPRGRAIVVVWAGAEGADIVKFQQTAGRYAPKPPVDGVGPGALADVSPFVRQLSAAGLGVDVKTAYTEFTFPSFDVAWDSLAAVTTANLDDADRKEAQTAVRELMWSHGDSNPRSFRNKIQLILATKSV